MDPELQARLDQLDARLAPLWGEDEARAVSWPLAVRTGRVG